MLPSAGRAFPRSEKYATTAFVIALLSWHDPRLLRSYFSVPMEFFQPFDEKVVPLCNKECLRGL
jgi:hypothetical protein